MGSIRDTAAQPDERTHVLNEEEFNYVMNLQQAKTDDLAKWNRTISAFLKYITVSRLNYTSDEDLQFELDFSDKEHKLKITTIPKEV
jgi:hypothetical protein